jgi:hypothetical protein
VAAIHVVSREVVWDREHGGFVGGRDTGNLCDATGVNIAKTSRCWMVSTSEVEEESDEMATWTRSSWLLDVVSRNSGVLQQ